MRGTGDLTKVSATTCEKTAESERCGRAAGCKVKANAKADDSCGMAKVRETMWEEKGTVCKGIAKGKWNATRNGRVQETTRRWLPQETICEKEKGESRQQAALCKGSSIVWETAKADAEKYRDKAKSVARMIEQEKMFSEVKAAVRRAKCQERMFSEAKAAVRRAK